MHTSLPTYPPESDFACVVAAFSCGGAGWPLSCQRNPELTRAVKPSKKAKRRGVTSQFLEAPCIESISVFGFLCTTHRLTHNSTRYGDHGGMQAHALSRRLRLAPTVSFASAGTAQSAD